MKQIFRGGRELPQGKGSVRLLADEQVNMLSCVKGLNECPKEQSKYVLECERFLHYGRNDGGILRQMVLMIFCVLFSSLLVSPAFGQEADGLNKVQSLMIGSKVPDEFWKKEHRFYLNGDTVFKTLEEYKGKMIVFDFWATWCASCVEAFSRLTDLQSRFKSDVVFLLVNSKRTKDDISKIVKVIDEFPVRNAKPLNVSTIMEDTTLANLFAHRLLPHISWIDKNGLVVAHTHAEELNVANISSFIAGKRPKVHMKNDFFVPVSIDNETDSLNLFSVKFSSYTEGLGNRTPRLEESGDMVEYSILNYNLSYYFMTAYSREELVKLKTSHWVFESNIDSLLVRKLRFPSGYEDQYCYRLRYNKNSQIMEPEEMLKIDLARVFGLQVNIVTKSVPVYVLKANSLFDKYKSTSKQSVWHTSLNDSPKYVKNVPFTGLMGQIELLFSGPVVLEVSPRRFVDLELPDDVYSYNENQLISYLNGIGIDVEKEVRELKLAVFSKVTSFSNSN